MKVLIVHPNLSAGGGAEEYAKAIIRTLIHRGHSVQVMQSPFPKWFPILFSYTWACLWLRLFGHSADRVIYSFAEGPAQSVPTLRLRHAPAVFDPSLIHLLGADPSFLRRAVTSICAYLARPYLGPVAVDLANSRWTADQLDNVQILYPPHRKSALTSTKDLLRFVILGRLVPAKRIEDGINTIIQLRQMGVDAQLDIIGRGSGPYANKLVRLVRSLSFVRIHQNATDMQVDTILSRATYGLHLFKGEHFGIAVAQMISAGVIPFVYDDGGIIELVQDPRLRVTSDLMDKVFAAIRWTPKERAQLIQELANSSVIRQSADFDCLLVNYLERVGL